MQFNISELESPLTQINELLLKKKNSKAIKYLNKFLHENPSNNNAWLLLGIAKRRIGNLDDAIVCFKTVIEFNPTSLEAWGLLTITYLDNGQNSLAERTIEQARELNPDDEKIEFYHENLIRIYKKFGPFF